MTVPSLRIRARVQKLLHAINESIPGAWMRFVIIACLIGLCVFTLVRLLGKLSINVWVGAVASGLGFGLVALAVFISFRVLNCPDLTVDGSLPLGAAIAASMIVAGMNPYITFPIAVLAGALAGVVTALITTRLHIHTLLASILTTTALFTINLRIMGRSNIPLMNTNTIVRPFIGEFRAFIETFGGASLAKLATSLFMILYVGTLVLLIKLIFDWFMRTDLGLSMRAMGDNPQMIRSLGKSTNMMVIIGLAISNGLASLSGAIYAQFQGFADINMGTGIIIAGLAAVILGETVFRPKTIAAASTAVIVGMILYRLVIAAALSIALPLPGGLIVRVGPQDVKLATALLVVGVLAITHFRKREITKN